MCYHIKNYRCQIMGVPQVNTNSLNDHTLKKKLFTLHEKGIFSLLYFTVYFPVCTSFTSTEHSLMFCHQCSQSGCRKLVECQDFIIFYLWSKI